MAERSFRIRTDVGKDKVVHVNLQQDYSFLEILSLKINQLDTYKKHVSNYGVLVGRVLANDNFGIPNAKVSVFIPLEDNDLNDTDIRNLYPYEETSDKDKDGRRYNLLPDDSNDECYRVIGSFPNKRLVLDNDTYVEVFEKYWKYTTVTNKSGDYMIMGLPTGNQTVHVDLDLSDIGILSQKPIDMMYKGYNETQFDNAKQFKESTNLDNLVQLISQNSSVNIYPFWGDESVEEIAISRCDVQIQYKFEPTCVFFGSIVSDNSNNALGHKCSPSKHVGFNRSLVTGEGTIEMIRKTQDNLVEEFQIQGNRLIDGDGVWCYQIPMNLDYVGTDEFGNIVPTDNPNKGIPTRTSVRFRVSMQETNNEGISRHRAKYLIPNVQDVVKDKVLPLIENPKDFDKCYEFGSATPDEYFRDLYWNKVYSVKNYIPRLQTNGKKNTQNYSGLRSVNANNNLNPVPFNHARYRLVFAYRVLCMLMTIVIYIICFLNLFFSALACFCLPRLPIIGKICPFKPLAPGCFGFSGGLTEDDEGNNEYFPCCAKCGKMKCSTAGCNKVTDKEELINIIQQTLAQEYDTVNLDFYNDWLNGALYLPLWHWRKTKKQKFFFGLFSKKAVNSFCDCNKNFPKLRLTQNCSLTYGEDDYSYKGNLKDDDYHKYYPKEKTFTVFGVIKEYINRAGLKIYYYAPGIPNKIDYKNGFKDANGDDTSSYLRLFSTDIILLGSLNSCDLDNYPNVFANLPSTTANVPFIATVRYALDEEEASNVMEGTSTESGYVEVTGMDWLHEGEDGKPKYGAGLFIDLACNEVYTKPKSCINVERLSELGVNSDMYVEEYYSKNNKLETNIILADGMITRYEISDHETRAMFASLNNNGFKEKVYNPNTGYETYKLRYVYPNDFDGHLESSTKNYTSMMKFKSYDIRNDDYVAYRFGLKEYSNGKPGNNEKLHFYSKENKGYSFPLFNNSFYFYFGLNEGKTAIDKFNKKFYASCYKNVKFPFTFDVSTTPAKWCPKTNQDYATITITFKTIKTPYSYTLYNEFNEPLVSEEGLSKSELKFGYKLDENGEYTDEKYGNLIYQLTGEDVLDENGKPIKLENGVYNIEIIDANGNKGSNKIIIDQVPISLEYETIELGNKYYENISIVKDFCNDNEYYGELRISKIIIDGEDYTITGIGEIEVNKYRLSLNDGSSVELEIKPTTLGENFRNDCTCNGVYVPYAKIENNILIFHIWIPQNYDLVLTQYCDTNPEPNSTTLTVTIKNGQPFNAYLNDTPIRLILGKNEEFDKYNNKLYKNIYANDVEKLPFWFKLHDESFYQMPEVDIKNKDVWGDFLVVNTELTNDEGTEEDLTVDSRLAIMEYKFKSLFNLCKTCYVVDDGESYMQLSYTGGKKPYLIRGVYPMYDEITEEHKIEEYRYDCQGYVTCESSHPNIITYNYTYLDENGFPKRLINYPPKESIPNIIDFNELIVGHKIQGNYFAAFTQNGGYNEGTCVYNDKNKYQQYPYRAAPNLATLPCPSGETTSSSLESKIYNVVNPNRPYFRGLFLDKRFDYSFIIMTPYAADDIASIGENDEWKYGYISGTTYNGNSMCYDNEYNIIGSNTTLYEYTYKGYNDGMEAKLLDYDIEVNNNEKSKRFYKADMKLGNQTIDLRNDLMTGFTTIDDEGNIIYDQNLNYPIVRQIRNDFEYTFDKMEFTVESCSYDVDMSIVDDDEKQYISAVTQGFAETNFTISCDKTIDIQLPTLEECATNDTYNVRFVREGGNMVSKNLTLEFKLKNDTRNSTHSVYTYIPRLYIVKLKGSNINNLNELKKETTIKGIRSNIETYGGTIFDVLKDSDVGLARSSWRPDIGRLINNNDLFNGDQHWRGSDMPNESIIFDDSKEVKNVIYQKKVGINNVDVGGIVFFRNYLNNTGDNLTKEIVTIQTAAIFDFRQFELVGDKCEVVSLENVESESTSTSVTTGSATVTTSSTDSSGNTTTGSASGGIDADTTTTTETSSTTQVQFTRFIIKWIEGDPNYNQQFVNSEKLTAIFKVDNKMTSTVSITSSNNAATIDVYWNGDLDGEFLGVGSRKAKLFIQMANKMIYMLDFTIRCVGGIVSVS